LNPRLNAKTRFEVLDMDYLKKLDDAQLQFMNQFMGEYVSGAFKKDENGNYSKENLHKTVEERRECYTRNNVRNRCGLTISNATGQTYRADDITSFMDNLSEVDSNTDTSNILSDTLLDEYDGDYLNLEMEMLKEMLEDYEKCINPKSVSDKKLAESNYGKSLLLRFKNSNFVKKG
jgi:hypothetical protein